MDNGHNNAIFGGNPDMGGSLNEENWQRSLEISAPVDMPAPEQVAKTEIASTEDAGLYSAENALAPDNSTPAAPENQTINIPENPYELGQITSTEVPVDPANPAFAKPPKYNPVNIKTTGDHLDKSTVPEINNIIEELSQTGDLNNFYDEIRGTDEKPGMMEANLQNSFNRKLGQDQGKAA